MGRRDRLGAADEVFGGGGGGYGRVVWGGGGGGGGAARAERGGQEHGHAAPDRVRVADERAGARGWRRCRRAAGHGAAAARLSARAGGPLPGAAPAALPRPRG